MTTITSPVLIAWAGELLAEFGWMLVGLLLVFLASGPIRTAVKSGRLGAIAPDPPLPALATWALLMLPIACWLLSIYSAHTWPASFIDWVREDGIVENAQALLLLAGVVMSVSISRCCRKGGFRAWSWCYLLLAMALFCAAGEEISWGQRLLHIPTPAWFEAHNVQGEMNLHNVSDFDDELSSGTDAAIQAMMLLGAGMTLTGLRRLSRLHAALWAPHPVFISSLACAVSFGPLITLYELVHPDGRGLPDALSQLQESREFILYGAVCAFLWLALRHARMLPGTARRHRDPSSPGCATG